ncbi:MAG: hypothetical protein QM779_09495 [Propionicimonas sp.]|uniref:hypothetical protein n=1 Tax=Propionicimonas sp. TaxID=1955623 RepID=UPI003D137BC7
MRTWLRLARAELPLLRDLPDFSERPLPRIGVDLGPTVPGWVLRAGAVVATGGCLVIATQRSGVADWLAGVLVVVGVVVMALWPSMTAACTATVVTGLLVAADGYGPFDPVVFGLVPLVWVGIRLAWWAERVALPARVEVAALARGVPRGLVLVGGTLVVGALAFELAGRPSSVLVLIGGVALVVLAGLVFARRR